MRLRYAVLAAALVAALAATTALAAIPATKTRTMRGNSHLKSGGSFQVTVKKRGSKQFRIDTLLKVRTKSATVLNLYAYPCGAGNCEGGQYQPQSVSGKTGVHKVDQHVVVPRVSKGGKPACVFVQLLDTGKNGGPGGKVVRTKSGKKGIRICEAA